MSHWLSFGKKSGLQLPKIFHVNWFLKDSQTNEFLWPGFGENIRVIDWIFRRLTNQAAARETPIGLVPDQSDPNGIRGEALRPALLEISKDFWQKECAAIRKYFQDNVNENLPAEIWSELNGLEKRLTNVWKTGLFPKWFPSVISISLFLCRRVLTADICLSTYAHTSSFLPL